jgi:hypothetical protein
MNTLDLNFDINEYREKFSEENLEAMKNEITKYKTSNLERLQTTEICLCESSKCKKNAVYYYKKNNNQLLCWYHALLLKN